MGYAVGHWDIHSCVEPAQCNAYAVGIAILSYCPCANSVLFFPNSPGFMVERVTNVVILVVSAALFSYWFRYVCLLILAAKTALDHSDEVASTNLLDFREVQSILQGRTAANLDSLHWRLERDYSIILYLLGHTPGSSGESRVEAAMLRLHYRLMSTWFYLTRRLLRETACQALEEMSMVVVHLANTLGERLPVTL